jgi:hypothetical protein
MPITVHPGRRPLESWARSGKPRTVPVIRVDDPACLLIGLHSYEEED